MKVWINGQFFEDTEAKISVFDAGFQHSVGLFETMVAKNGGLFRGEEHLDRLCKSATELRLTETLCKEPLLEALNLTLTENEQKNARLRLTITGGDLNLLQSAGKTKHSDPTIVIQSQPLTEYPGAFFEKGTFVSLASGRINPYELGAGHKTLNYWPKLLNLQLAAMYKCGEAIWLTPGANITGGCVSNVFTVKDNLLQTPIARGEEASEDGPSATLPGITRLTIIEIAEQMGLGVRKCPLTLDDLLEADEVFLTNSSWGILPVVGVRAITQEAEKPGIQEQSIGESKVGEISKSLLSTYNQTVEEETKKNA